MDRRRRKKLYERSSVAEQERKNIYIENVKDRKQDKKREKRKLTRLNTKAPWTRHTHGRQKYKTKATIR